MATVRELIETLSNLDPNLEVCVDHDGVAYDLSNYASLHKVVDGIIDPSDSDDEEDVVLLSTNW